MYEQQEHRLDNDLVLKHEQGGMEITALHAEIMEAERSTLWADFLE